MSSDRPDILFVLPDQLRKDVCAPYGGGVIATPAMDRLASEGVTFDNAVSPCPLCTPYRGMLLTGRYPTHSGVLNNFVEISPRQNPNSLAVILGSVGYETAYVGKWHLAAGEYGGAGEHPSFVPPGPARMGFDRWAAYNFHMDTTSYWYYRDVPEKIRDPRYETDAVFAEAREIVESRRPEDPPLFMVVAPHAPHPPFAEAYAPEGYLEEIPEEIYRSANVPEDNPRSPSEMRVYLAMVKNFDDNLGRFLDAVDRSDRGDSTLLVFTSDHGEMHGSHGRLNKMVPYAESIDLPLIVRWPESVAAGGRNSSLITPMDFLPTFASLAGAKTPAEVDGDGFSAELLGDPASSSVDRSVLLMNYSSHWNYFRSETPETAADWRCWPEWRGVRTSRYTYVRWLTGREELYDNIEDPYQLTDLTDDPPATETLEFLRGELRRLLSEAHDEFLPGDAYADWFDERRRLLRTGLGPV